MARGRYQRNRAHLTDRYTSVCLDSSPATPSTVVLHPTEAV